MKQKGVIHFRLLPILGAMERGILRGLFKQLDKVEKEMLERGFNYPRGSHFFPSSVPHHIESKEEVVRYFKEEIQKLKIISRKLGFWLDEYIDRDLDSLRIDLPSETELNDSLQNLTIPELHLFYQPINPRTGKVYTIRAVRDWFNDNPMLHLVVRLSGRRYSRNDFERYLRQAGISYDERLTATLFDFANSERAKHLAKQERDKELRRIAARFQNGSFLKD